MRGKGHNPEQILSELRQVEVAIANDKSVGQAVPWENGYNESFSDRPAR